MIHVPFTRLQDIFQARLAKKKKIPKKLKLRLDANRLWDYSQAHKFLNSIYTSQIEYLEEPFADSARFFELYEKTGVFIALDETLHDLKYDKLARVKLKGIGALILKPTILGGINKTIKMIKPIGNTYLMDATTLDQKEAFEVS